MAKPPNPSRLRATFHPSWSVGTAVAAALLTAVAVALVVRARVQTGPLTTADLQVFWLSGKAIRTGHDPYLFWLPGAQISLVYPPFAGLLMAPVSLIPLAGLRIVWFAGVIVAAQAIIWLTARWAGVRFSRWWLLLCPVLGVVALLVDPVWQELWSGQVNVFIVLLVIADLSRRDGARGKGIGVGLAAGIKLTPGLFIAYLALTRRYREAVTALVTFVATVAVGFVAMPAGQAWRYWTDYAWNVDRMFSTPGVIFNQSLRGAVARLLHHDSVAPWAAVVVVVAIAGLAVCVALHRRGLDREGVALCGVTALLVSPVSWVYHWVWLVPVVVLLVVGAVRTRSAGWIGLAVLTAAVVVLHPYTWIGGFSAMPSALFAGSQGWWLSWTSYFAAPHGLGGQLLSDSLVLLGFALLAGGAVLAWRRPLPGVTDIAREASDPEVSIVVSERDEAKNLPAQGWAGRAGRSSATRSRSG